MSLTALQFDDTVDHHAARSGAVHRLQQEMGYLIGIALDRRQAEQRESTVRAGGSPQRLTQAEGRRFEVQFRFVLMEAEHDRGLAGGNPAQGEVQAEEGLAGAWAAQHQGGCPTGKPAPDQSIQLGQRERRPHPIQGHRAP